MSEIDRILEIASLLERGQVTQPRKLGRELRLLAAGMAKQPKTHPDLKVSPRPTVPSETTFRAILNTE